MKVIWSKSAHQERIRIVDYLVGEFGINIAINFDEQLAKFESLVSEMPNIGSAEPLLAHRVKKYQSFVVHRLCKVIYCQEHDVIHIAALWDTRREPKTMSKVVK